MKLIMKKLTYLFLFVCLNFTATAQSDYELKFKNNELLTHPNLRTYLSSYVINQDEIVEGYYYRLIQFNKTPSLVLHERIKSLGLELVSYIPSKAYIVAIPVQFDPSYFNELDIRFISALRIPWIQSEALSQTIPEWAQNGDKIKVSIRFPENITPETFKILSAEDNVEITESNNYNHVVHAEILAANIDEVTSLPYVHYLDLIPPPSVPDDIHGRALHSANRIDRQLPGELNITGAGVSVLTRDDGAIGPHIDFQGRLDQEFSGPSRGTHGDGVSGIFAGAGNLNPRMRGMAAGADLYVIDYVASFLDETMDLHFNNDVLVTNSSYSNGCNAGYTNSTSTVDEQCFDNPTLMHVFSAGNSNNLDCDYGAGDQWGNITGGHKQGKNVIATANTDRLGTIQASSSRGPAFDGRIKPDIAANGAAHMSTAPNNSYLSFGGTSGAAPGIAGIMAMLHEAYREKFSLVADGALLKALLLNTANEKGNKGPDFIFGWGMVNAYRAHMAMDNNQFLKDELDPGETKQYSIPVPDNVAELRVMVYWMDQESSSGVTKSLVNDIDIKINDGTTDHLPWVLNEIPDPSLLNADATKGEDHLNNMEQVSIESPDANNTYTLEVSSTDLPFGTHEFYVVWEYRLNGVEFVFPAGGEKVNNFDSDVIQWEAYDIDGDFALALSVDEGVTWLELADVDEAERIFVSSYPNVVTDKAQFRLVRNGNEYLSNTFTIARQPVTIDVVNVCPDSLFVEWNDMPGAIGYEVYLLGDKYMEFLKYVTPNSTHIPINAPTDVNWIAVSADYGNGIVSRRSYAQPLQADALVNCVQDNDLILVSIDNPNILQTVQCAAPYEDFVSVNIFNQGLLEATNISVSYTINNGPVVTELITDVIMPDTNMVYGFSVPFNLTQTDVYDFRAWVSTSVETSRFDDTLSVSLPFFLEGGALDLSENFSDSDDVPDFWVPINPDNDDTWLIDRVEQINGNNGNVLVMPFGSYSGSGQIDKLSMLPVDMTNAPTNVKLSMDMAYMEVFNSLDSMYVLASTDCGASFPDTLASWFNRELLTSDNGTLEPEDDDDWKTRYVDVSDYIGFNQVVFQLSAVNGSGNNLYFDNINIENANFSSTNANFTSTSPDNCILTDFNFINLSTGNIIEYYWDFGLDAEPEFSTEENPPTVFFKSPGLKPVSLITTNGAGKDTITQDIMIYGTPTGTISSSQVSKGVVYFESNVDGAMDYLWSFGDGGSSTDQNPTHNYLTSGVYEVELMASNDCRERTFELDLNLDVTSVNEEDIARLVNLYPNPTSGLLMLELKKELNLESVELFNIDGKLVSTLGIPSSAQQNGALNFDLSYYNEGVYLIKLKLQDDTIVKRVLIQR